MVALLHELEEDVRLLRAAVEVAEFVDVEDVKPRESVDELARGAIGEGGVHLVEEILGTDELAAVAVL